MMAILCSLDVYLSFGRWRRNELHFSRPNISEEAKDLLHMTDKMKTFY
jgi:hypothetical protein